MNKTLKTILITLSAVVLIIIGLFIAHEVIEARIFNTLQNQAGVEISIQSRTGNLLSGYDLYNVSLQQTVTRQNIPPAGFSTDRISIHWKLRPFSITEISWQEGSLTLKPSSGNSEDIPIGAANLLPTNGGWLESGTPIVIGSETWDGSAEIRIRADAREVDISVRIDRLPGRLIELMGTPPEGFTIPNQVILEMEITGSPQNLRVSGQVSDPLTRRSYRF